MSPLQSARRALPMTFFIYVLEALLASFAALPLGSELARSGVDLQDPSGSAILLESSELVQSLLRSTGIELAIGSSALLLLAPWLQMSWLVALTEPRSTLAALERGGQLCARAWLVSLYVLLLAALGMLPFMALAFLLHQQYDAAIDARTHDLAVSAALFPLAVCLLGAQLLHDLARARALTANASVSVRAALRVAIRPRVVAFAASFALLGLVVLIAVHLTIGPLASSSLGLALAAALLQGSVLARLFVRSTWLACAHRQVAPLADRQIWGDEP